MRKPITMMLDEKTIEALKERKTTLGIPISRTTDFALSEWFESTVISKQKKTE